jgi:N-acetylglutamate synthase-like GNAT family acetyltransferase
MLKLPKIDKKKKSEEVNEGSNESTSSFFGHVSNDKNKHSRKASMGEKLVKKSLPHLDKIFGVSTLFDAMVHFLKPVNTASSMFGVNRHSKEQKDTSHWNIAQNFSTMTKVMDDNTISMIFALNAIKDSVDNLSFITQSMGDRNAKNRLKYAQSKNINRNKEFSRIIENRENIREEAEVASLTEKPKSSFKMESPFSVLSPIMTIMTKTLGLIGGVLGGIGVAGNTLAFYNSRKRLKSDFKTGHEYSAMLGGILGGTGTKDNKGKYKGEGSLKNSGKQALKLGVQGAVVGFLYGGVAGAAIGGAIGAALGAVSGAIGGKGIAKIFDRPLLAGGALAGAVAGFMLGGVAGAAIGATVGAGIGEIVNEVTTKKPRKMYARTKSQAEYLTKQGFEVTNMDDYFSKDEQKDLKSKKKISKQPKKKPSIKENKGIFRGLYSDMQNIFSSDKPKKQKQVFARTKSEAEYLSKQGFQVTNMDEYFSKDEQKALKPKKKIQDNSQSVSKNVELIKRATRSKSLEGQISEVLSSENVKSTIMHTHTNNVQFIPMPTNSTGNTITNVTTTIPSSKNVRNRDSTFNNLSNYR